VKNMGQALHGVLPKRFPDTPTHPPLRRAKSHRLERRGNLIFAFIDNAKAIPILLTFAVSTRTIQLEIFRVGRNVDLAEMM
jgi:hypothetical protein